MLDATFVTTVAEIPGYRIAKNFGIVRGIVVRSRSIVGNLGATLQTLVGGNITIYTELCEKARADAHPKTSGAPASGAPHTAVSVEIQRR